MTLADVTGSRNNNLDMIRFLAAAAVILSHSFTLSLGYEYGDYLGTYTDTRLSLGGFAVGIFFFYGGFLIAKSCERHPKAKDYFSCRMIRIFPQLIFVVFACELH